jgi:MoxR-like ATPase
MQEEQVSIQGETFELDKPFFVLATQNPIESEGTYKLPEAQVDRFMFKLIMNYPAREEEKEIIRRFTKGHNPAAKKIISKSGILEIQKFCKKVYADEKIEDYVSKIVDATRNPKEYNLDFDSMIDCGASPRSSIWLILGAKAHALMQGRGYVLPEDVKEVAHEILRHRIMLSYEAEAEGKTPDEFIDKILATVKVP